MASDDDDIPETGAIFTFGKTRFAENLANKFWIRDDKVLQLACGDEHSAVITNSGRLYTFGSNDWGQLGHGNTKPYTKPSVVKRLKGDKVRAVACGRSHTLVITESGVFSFGAGADSQLGHGDSKSYNIPTQIESLDNKGVTKIACGAEHSAALTENGLLYMWGSGSEGQLGLGNSECEQPTQLKFRSKVMFVACGYYHTAVVTEDGKLYTFGDNDGGKLGLEEHQRFNTEEPQQVKTLNEHVDSVACGGSHTAVLTKSGRLYTFGYGMHGQLGHGPSSQDVPLPKLVTTLQRKFVTVVSCGESHTAVLTKTGDLYSFGDGRHGKLGQGNESFSNLFKPERVTRFKAFHVDQVACGGCHMLAVAARKEEDVEDSENSEEGLVPSIVTPTESTEDVVDGLETSPRLSTTVPLSSLSARDKRRQKDLENTTLGGSLPPLSRSSLPPLASLGISSTKKEPTKATSNGTHNPLDKSTLPTITLKGPSVDESGEKDSPTQSAEARRLPPRPKRRQKVPEPPSDSEEENRKTEREVSTKIRPKPLPRKQKTTTKNEINEENENSSQGKVAERPNAKDETGSDASGEDSEEDDVGDATKVTVEAPSTTQSLVQAENSKRIESKSVKAVDHSEEDEDTEEEDDDNEKDKKDDDIEEEDEDKEKMDEEEESDEDQDKENEKSTKSEGSAAVKKYEADKESETKVTVVEELDNTKEESENENEDKDEDKSKDGKNKDKRSNEDDKEDGRKKKKDKTKDKAEKGDDDKSEGNKSKSKDKKKDDKNDTKSEVEDSENKVEGTEEGKDQEGKKEDSKANENQGDKKGTKEDEKEGGNNRKDDKGKGQKSKKSGICVLL